jgi:hypothetical protein
VRAWRNGSRNGLKIRFSKGSAGSSPAARTSLCPAGYGWFLYTKELSRCLRGAFFELGHDPKVDG